MSKSFALQEQQLPICIILEIKTEKCIFKVYFIDYAITVVPFSSPFYFPQPCTPSPTSIPPFSSCSWVIHVSSLASTFSILFLLSPCHFLPTIYATYFLYLSPLSLPPTPLLITLHVIFISVVLFLFQLLAQFSFVFVLCVVVNNCEFAVIFTVHIFYLLFLR